MVSAIMNHIVELMMELIRLAKQFLMSELILMIKILTLGYG
jgi:hypothetical protein